MFNFLKNWSERMDTSAAGSNIAETSWPCILTEILIIDADRSLQIMNSLAFVVKLTGEYAISTIWPETLTSGVGVRPLLSPTLSSLKDRAPVEITFLSRGFIFCHFTRTVISPNPTLKTLLSGGWPARRAWRYFRSWTQAFETLPDRVL